MTDAECVAGLRAMATRLEWLESVVAKLPVTADGVPVVPGVDLVYRRYYQGRGVCAVEGFYDTASHLIAASYSTREAAEAEE